MYLMKVQQHDVQNRILSLDNVIPFLCSKIYKRYRETCSFQFLQNTF